MVTRVVADIGDDQLDAPAPCPGTTVAGLLDHLDGLCLAFTAAAAGTWRPAARGRRLTGRDWDRTGGCASPAGCTQLAGAWQARRPGGMTRAGGVDLPAEVAGRVAINEVVVHGWDLAAATRHDYACATELAQAAYAFVQSAVEQNPDGARDCSARRWRCRSPLRCSTGSSA